MQKMAHLCVLVIIPKDVVDIDSYVEQVLKPYDINASVEPYTIECTCKKEKIETMAVEETNKILNGSRYDLEIKKHNSDIYMKTIELLGGKENFDRALYENIELAMDANIEAGKIITPTLKERLSRRDELEKQFITKYEKTEKPDEDCEFCNGTGLEKTTTNPNGIWDWYLLGGRYRDSFLSDKELAEMENDPFNLTECTCNSTTRKNCTKCNGTGLMRIERNIGCEGYIKTIEQLPSDFVPFAIITTDGSWNENDMNEVDVDGTNEIWENQYRKLLTKENKKDIAVIVDCHT